MKAINLFPLLFTFLILACSDDENGKDKEHNSPSYSSSSQVSIKIDTLRLEGLGKSYRTITIGSLTWFAQNLNEIPTLGKWWCNGDRDTPGDFKARCDEFGKLYDWDAANNVCPKGWHLPSENEWEDFLNFILNYPNNILTDAWWNPTYGGYKHENENDYTKWYYLNDQGYWWTSTPAGSKRAYCYNIIKGQTRLYRYDEEREKSLSVRCVKDN